MGEHEKDPRQIDLVDYIEDAENSGPPAMEKTLSDEDLDRAGLVAVKAFVRSKASKNAERVRKAAERRERARTVRPGSSSTCKRLSMKMLGQSSKS